MSSEQERPRVDSMKGQLFAFDWTAVDVATGVKFAIGVATVTILSSFFPFEAMVAGVGALLAWLCDVPGSTADQVRGLLAFGLLGVPVTLLAQSLGANLWVHVAVLFAVSLAGTMLMMKGTRVFMVSWGLIYWFLLAPLFGSPGAGSWPTIQSFLLGVGVVVALTLIAAWLEKAPASLSEAPDIPYQPTVEPEEQVDPRLALGYSLTVAATMAVCLVIGGLWVESDYTLIAGAAFMVIGMNKRQTWLAGIGRGIGAVAGIVVGFYLVPVLQGDLVSLVFGAVTCFLAIALAGVNPAMFIFFFMIYLSPGWLAQGLEQANLIANERILAEITGVLAAGIAVSVLTAWSSSRPEQSPDAAPGA